MTLEAEPVSPGEALSGKLSGKYRIMPTPVRKFSLYVMSFEVMNDPCDSYFQSFSV